VSTPHPALADTLARLQAEFGPEALVHLCAEAYRQDRAALEADPDYEPEEEDHPGQAVHEWFAGLADSVLWSGLAD
jgi:hypothetical protein